jgi:hypothetical protein
MNCQKDRLLLVCEVGFVVVNHFQTTRVVLRTNIKYGLELCYNKTFKQHWSHQY